MKLYENKFMYYSMKQGVNGRGVLPGFAPHAYSGKIFRFNETHPKKVDSRGIIHLKRAVSYSFKNTFDTFEEYEKWVDSLFKKFSTNEIIKMSWESIPSFVYTHHYIRALAGKPVNGLVRLDQSASAISIWGLIANCEYSKIVSNIKYNGKGVCKTYIRIAEDYLKTSVREIKNFMGSRFSNRFRNYR